MVMIKDNEKKYYNSQETQDPELREKNLFNNINQKLKKII